MPRKRKRGFLKRAKPQNPLKILVILLGLFTTSLLFVALSMMKPIFFLIFLGSTIPLSYAAVVHFENIEKEKERKRTEGMRKKK